MRWSVALLTFGLLVPAELPDKTMIATVLLSRRGRPVIVWAGAAVAFAAQAAIGVVAGGLVSKLPQLLAQILATATFAGGAAWLLLGHEPAEAAGAAEIAPVVSAHRTFITAAGIVFLAELGDFSQLLIAGLAAHFHDPLSVLAGAVAALWLIAALGVVAGRTLIRNVRLSLLRKAAGALLAVLTAVSVVRLLGF
ncbi:MAG: TMEM165/GDT1 family protein [Acidimicrobiales bacterium]